MGEQKTLTMEQVEAAGLFAWHGSGYVFSHGLVIKVEPSVLSFGGSAEYGGQIEAQIGIAYAWDTDGMGALAVRNGWHHLSGCDCELCAS